MPPPRKIDRLPAELHGWLKDELRRRGFGGYEDLADALNLRLEAEGLDLRIRKSAIHAYGQEYESFIRYQDEASSWAAGWMNEQGMGDEARRHGVLFQMLTTLAFKAMQSRMEDAAEIDPKELHFLGRMLKDVMASSGLREAMLKEERKAQTARLEEAVKSGDIDAAAAQRAREIMGWA
jgi:hypothetical protein